jgi:hypothetical protein
MRGDSPIQPIATEVCIFVEMANVINLTYFLVTENSGIEAFPTGNLHGHYNSGLALPRWLVTKL